MPLDSAVEDVGIHSGPASRRSAVDASDGDFYFAADQNIWYQYDSGGETKWQALSVGSADRLADAELPGQNTEHGVRPR
jgi:hypothetical protein